MITVYVLQQKDKFYIGKTKDPVSRIEKHFDTNKYACHWTTLHHPTNLVELKFNVDKHCEMNTTLDYMAKYGIDKVRGGPFCRQHLSQKEKSMIIRLLNDMDDRCMKCCQKGHMANKCNTNRKKHIFEKMKPVKKLKRNRSNFGPDNLLEEDSEYDMDISDDIRFSDIDSYSAESYSVSVSEYIPESSSDNYDS